jgi:pimeloyl-ACP methyl ester carboxylesterase
MTSALAICGVSALLAMSSAPANAAPPAGLPSDLQSCRLPGVEHEAWCGRLLRPLDAQAPAGRSIEVHFAVLPAASRSKKPDPVFFLAGGPGQSAIALAGHVSRLLARVNTRRDLVLVDQRGTGRSAVLRCADEEPTASLREQTDPQAFVRVLLECRSALSALPYGDLRQFTTTQAMQDLDAVRQHLKAERINLVGGSYGTRAALEYQRQFPQQVRRSVIDGVAPPDMVLPASFSTDAQAALDGLLAGCQADERCRRQYPTLGADWQALLAAPAREVVVSHPVTGRPERITLARDHLLMLVRLPLYAPTLASALPLAITEAARGRYEALMGLATGLTRGRETRLAMGMHLSVVCAEDWPRMAQAGDRPGADFGDALADVYRQACKDWPRGPVPAAFYAVPPAATAVLVLSGGADPVTPPRHGDRVTRALGGKARHIVVGQAGHGVMSLPCMRDVIFRFIDAADDAAALAVDAACVANVPRPGAFVPVGVQTATSGATK